MSFVICPSCLGWWLPFFKSLIAVLAIGARKEASKRSESSDALMLKAFGCGISGRLAGKRDRHP